MFESRERPSASRVWRVGALCQAIASALNARFNPVSVEGEVTSFTRAASGHCYFTLRDDTGQLRCAMFRRAAGLLDFPVRDGDKVEVRGTLGVYEARGELQLVVESMRRAGQGSLFEQFLALKSKLEQEGLFDASRKRDLPVFPRGIGIVTSLGAAALHDVVSALQRRAPHVQVVIAPASVQGEGAPAELARALQNLYAMAVGSQDSSRLSHIDAILLVRGGGAMEDLWAFNDESLARQIVQSPVPVVSGVGHETDFTIADFVADLRAPTPTAAAELVARPGTQWTDLLESVQDRLDAAAKRTFDRQSQRLDLAVSRLGRPSGLAMHHRLNLESLAQRLGPAAKRSWRDRFEAWQGMQAALPVAKSMLLRKQADQVDRMGWRLSGSDPATLLKRGYAWLTDSNGKTIGGIAQVHQGQTLQATLADGVVDLQVQGQRPN